MEKFYPLITVLSMLAFGWLGWRMGSARNRNPQVWMAAGALLPPLLLVLMSLGTLGEGPDDEETDEAA
ncbi:MAG: hypothetical protein SFV19_13000 [Rhodospirillaceae bacterium]|nr:hypothetical protein [Rhodospirillaceae bacterium]